MAQKEQTANTGAQLEVSRREKLQKLVELGIDPWGHRFDDHSSVADIRAKQDEIVKHPLKEGQRNPDQDGPKVRAAGRVVLQRKKGKLVFLDLHDWTGRIQVFLGKNQVGEENWEMIQCLDLGDIIGVDGELRWTNTGELTIFAADVHYLTKSIETPPAKHKGLQSPDLRQRMRYMDLVHTDGVLERFRRRATIVRSIRETLSNEGFLEIEGPTLQTIAGGAAARPFETHHNALDINLFLRIALELPLKKLLVGGMEKVFELGRNYRNEGIDQTHNPEFTMMEVYQAYADYEVMMELTEKLISNAIEATGQEKQLDWEGLPIDFSAPFERKKYHDLLAEHTGVDPHDADAMAKYATDLGLETKGKHPDVVKNEIFEAKVEDNLIGPVFVMDYPASICPLTKRKKDDPTIAERFELFIHGTELANAYTELNDPDLQEELFKSQLDGLAEEESMAKMDHEFIRAMRHGMPPAGGLGIGIDRLVMVLTGTRSIREVILFPLLRPERDNKEQPKEKKEEVKE